MSDHSVSISDCVDVSRHYSSPQNRLHSLFERDMDLSTYISIAAPSILKLNATYLVLDPRGAPPRRAAAGQLLQAPRRVHVLKRGRRGA